MPSRSRQIGWDSWFGDATGLPVGFTLVAPACSDLFVLALADDYQRFFDRPLGALGATMDDAGRRPGDLPPSIPLAVVGAHLSGQPLNDQLVYAALSPPRRAVSGRLASVLMSDACSR